MDQFLEINSRDKQAIGHERGKREEGERYKDRNALIDQEKSGVILWLQQKIAFNFLLLLFWLLTLKN